MLLEIPKRIIIQETLVKTEYYWKYLKKNNNSGNPGEDGVPLEVPKTTIIQETLVKTECYWKYLKNNNLGYPGEDGNLLEVPKKE
jgi:hypothetical protein